jgi:hypothetical protein
MHTKSHSPGETWIERPPLLVLAGVLCLALAALCALRLREACARLPRLGDLIADGSE